MALCACVSRSEISDTPNDHKDFLILIGYIDQIFVFIKNETLLPNPVFNISAYGVNACGIYSHNDVAVAFTVWKVMALCRRILIQ